MRKLAFWILLALVGGFALDAAAQDEGTKGIRFHQNESWEEMLKLAQKEDKMIFMDCYTVWCGPCKALARDIFPQEKVGDFFNPRFINVQYDMEKGDGKMLYDKYKKYIVGFPTLLLLDKNGNVLQQMAGYHEADDLIEGIRKASEGKDLFTLGKKYQEGERSFEFVKDYMDALNAAFLKDSAAAVATEYIARMDLNDLDKDEVWNLLGEYIKDVNSPAFDYLVKNANRYYYKLHRDRYKIDRQVRYAVRRELDRIVDIDFDEDGKPLPLRSDSAMEQKGMEYMVALNLPGLNEMHVKFYIHHLLLDGQYEEAWRHIMDAVKMGITGFYTIKIGDYVKYMMAHTTDKDLLKEFLAVLQKAQSEEGDDDFSFHTYKTMSGLCGMLGQKKEAKEYMALYEQKAAEARKKYESFLKAN